VKKILGKLTYANVIATVALFIALGGASYAAFKLPKNSVGARQLKKGAVTPAKLTEAAKSTLTGPAGPQGTVGPRGAVGPQGPRGATGISNVVVRLGPDENGSEAFCKPGEVAVGGGGIAEEGSSLLYASLPIDATGELVGEGGTAVGWFAGASPSGGGESASQAYALCASPSG
jgi:hypothetical protein